MKNIKYALFLVVSLFIFPICIRANSISSIDMDIYIDKLGNAHVKEVWQAKLNQGTEGYKPYYNLGNATISDFKVSFNGQNYTYKEKWNTSSSFDSKAYKNGINYISNGLELCWGISKYGNNKYTLEYVINGFVSTLNDADMVYWTLIPYELSSKPDNVHIKIYSDEKFSDSLDVWGYGNYGGTAYVYDGYIEMNSEGVLESNEYMTILVKFDKGAFETSNKLNSNFNHYFNMAEEGSTKYVEEKPSFLIRFINFIFALIRFIPFILVVVAVIGSAKKAGQSVGNKNLNFGTTGRKVPKDVPNIRDLPFNKDIYRTFWLAEAYKLNSKKTDFLGAILLKWLKEQKISIKKIETGLFKKKEEATIVLNKDLIFENPLEQKLMNMMYEASRDGMLESNEFKNWCSSHYSKILNWFDSVVDSETDKLINENKISIVEKTNLKIFKSQIYEVNPSMMDEAKKLRGLKNFLDEFSRIDEREAIEVSLWEYYLIYAQILGIADRVAKQFKKLYPEILENNQYGYDYSDVIFIRNISYAGVSSAASSKSRAESYSSGGGGFSSGGGGGGSFGGGGGGGGFR